MTFSPTDEIAYYEVYFISKITLPLEYTSLKALIILTQFKCQLRYYYTPNL